MHAPHHPGEINFYEELGVDPRATPEEIRDTFRALVRMLHPDQQMDEQLKVVADRQLRKLNAVYAVLSDPERRRIYDEDLDDGFEHPIIVNNAAPNEALWGLGRKLVWVAAILVGAGLLAWLASSNESAPPSRAHDQAAALSLEPQANGKTGEDRADQFALIARLRADLRALAIERDQAVRERDELRAATPSKRESRPWQPPPVTQPERAAAMIPNPMPAPPGFPATVNVTTTTLALPTSALPKPDVGAPPAGKSLAGFWFYVKQENNTAPKGRGNYVPEFMEATITEDNGVLRGNYRSRFRIVDRAISPDVTFSFSGAPKGSILTCPWTGPGGAKGELTLRLTSENSLRLDWMAVELGTQQGLLSGTAVLTRKVD